VKICNTTGAYDFFHIPQLERLGLLERAGYRNIDVSFYREGRLDSVFMQDHWTEYADAMKRYGEEHGLSFVQAHCPMGNPLTMDDKRELLLASTIRSLEVCGRLGIKNAVFHHGWALGIGKDEFTQRNLEFLQQLIPTLEATGVTLCYENLIHRPNVERVILSSADDILEYLACAGHPLVQACWDTGHGGLSVDSQYDNIVKLGSHLRAVHIHDNRGEIDEHILPYMGVVNWDEIMHVLLDISFPGYFTLEASSVVRFGDGSLYTNARYLRKSYEKDTRALNPTVDMQVAVQSFGYTIAKQILTAYNCFED